MPTEKKRVLITVKAYPNPSTKYKETVCCAGIDLDTKEWIRLYPIPFRYLKPESQFRKYSIIEIRCDKADDKRPERYRVDADSIKIIDYVEPSNKWHKRSEIVIPTLSQSFCQIKKESEEGNKSLGGFRPKEIDFEYSKASLKNTEKHEDLLTQINFFHDPKGIIEQIPFDFYYTFKCLEEPSCLGHKLPIIDWEIGEAFRKWKAKYTDEGTLLEMIKEKWLVELCSEKKDVSFFVGNQLRFRQNFMILGVYYPPKNQISK